MSGLADRSSRFRPGHPEGYALAFADLNRDYAQSVIRDAFLEHLPSVHDGLSTMALIDAASASAECGGAVVRLPTAGRAGATDT